MEKEKNKSKLIYTGSLCGVPLYIEGCEHDREKISKFLNYKKGEFLVDMPEFEELFEVWLETRLKALLSHTKKPN